MYQQRIEQQQLAEKEAHERRQQEEQLARELREKIARCADQQCAGINEAVASIADGADPSMVCDALAVIFRGLEETKDVWGSDDIAASRIKECIMLLFESAAHVHIQFNDAAQVEASKAIRSRMRDILACCGVLGESDEDLEMEFDMDCSRDEEIARQLAAEMEQEAYGGFEAPEPTIPFPMALVEPPAPVLGLRQPRRRTRRAAVPRVPDGFTEEQPADPQIPPPPRQRRRRTARAEPVVTEHLP